MNAVGGRYVLKEEIGSGGMGVVWLAHDELLHREVAVKQLKLPDLAPAASEVARTRAMREARIAARLQHPNAIVVYDVVVEDDLPWIVMEYLPSRSLAALVEERGPLTPAEAARIGEKVAAALAAAHAKGIVHRDVKPGNVLIGHDGTVKLTDFGISRATGDVTITEAGALAGTPAYLAPEVARGDAPDSRSDLFSLGATLYAAVENRSPYGDSDNNLGLLYRAATGKLERPVRAGSLSRPLELLLAVDPAQRPTATQATALLQVLPTEVIPTPKGIPVQAPPPPAQTPSEQTRPQARPTQHLPPRPQAPPPSTPAPRARPRWLVPVLVVCLLLGGAAAARAFLPLGGRNHDAPSSSSSTTTTPKAVQLTDQVASNFVLGYLRSVKHETRGSWEKLTDASRKSYADYEESTAAFDELIPLANPEVVRSGDDFLVIGKVKVVTKGVPTTKDYRFRVLLVEGRPRLQQEG
ncbi:serine/threonine-protein kinase [Umezawaea endophytica]|uniref:non-specific serine/threonine protein kinase n=1 Tax=Umezawaea endophytica TaxID=1654476 RepID=A0A9X2VV73_9PSEU|nr:serine/threonine-protein kinase [Umezawaea endophytica]MCS7482258.1 serine/threonine protein kinase [Umezawaea endophytica]